MNVLCWGAVLVAALTVAACGGSGGSGGNNSGGSSTNTSGNYSVTIDTQQLDFSAVRNQGENCSFDAQSVNIRFKGDSLILEHPPGVDDPYWRYIQKLTNVTSSSATLTVEPSFYCQQPPGNYSTRLRLVSGKQDGSVVVYDDLVVNYSVEDNLAFAESDDLTVAITADALKQGRAAEFKVDTWGTEWQLVSDQDWLIFDPAASTGNNSQDYQTVSVSVDLSKVPDVNTEASFSLQKVDGTSMDTENISFKREAVRVWLDQRALALSLFDGEANTQTILNLHSNSAIDFSTLNLTAGADWLVVNTNRREVIFSVDRGALAAGFYRTSVSMAQDGQYVGPEFQVGLYIHDGALSAEREISLQRELRNPVVVADPLGPYVYTLHSPTVKVFNIYTGALVEELDYPQQEGTIFGGHHHQFPHYVTDDGAVLYVSNQIDHSLATTGDEEPIYHRYDLVNKVWLSDVSAIDYAKPIAVQGRMYHRSYDYPPALVSVEDRQSIFYAELECGMLRSSAGGEFLSRIHKEGNALGYPLRGYEVIQPEVYLELGQMNCEVLHRATSHQIGSYFDYLKMDLSASGQFMLLGSSLLAYDQQQGFSVATYLALPSIFDGTDESSRIIEGALVDDSGSAFIAVDERGVAEYITQYNKQGDEIQTFPAEDKLMQSSSDGRTLLLSNSHLYGDENPSLIVLDKTASASNAL